MVCWVPYESRQPRDRLDDQGLVTGLSSIPAIPSHHLYILREGGGHTMRSLWMGTRCCCWMERRVEIWRRRTLTASNGFDTPSVRSCKRMATSEMEVPVLTPTLTPSPSCSLHTLRAPTRKKEERHAARGWPPIRRTTAIVRCANLPSCKRLLIVGAQRPADDVELVEQL